jgi:dihydroflavonol-4-reductase
MRGLGPETGMQGGEAAAKLFMKVFVTGGTGFIGGHVVRHLRERGDEVRALVRSPEQAAALTELGCELIAGTLTDPASIWDGMEGCDAAIHGAAIYKVGIPDSERRGMYEANVQGTQNVLGAALDAKVGKVVYISTVGAFGNTGGSVVDETYEHPGVEFTSYYEQTKYEAHQIAKRLIADEHLPCVIVQPGGVYGPDDHSSIGQQMNQFLAGKMPLIAFPDLGMNMVHVDDVAAGVLLALDKGKTGESYVLGGQITTMRELIETLAKVSDRKPPKRALPTGLMKALTPVGPLVGKAMGQPPNLRELISSADNVTFWAKHDKAMAELGYAPRGLETGLRDMLAAEGKLPAAA